MTLHTKLVAELDRAIYAADGDTSAVLAAIVRHYSEGLLAEVASGEAHFVGGPVGADDLATFAFNLPDAPEPDDTYLVRTEQDLPEVDGRDEHDRSL